MVSKIKEFIGEVKAELKKVSWPTREQLKESTWVVISVTAIITLIVLAIDQAMTFGVTFISGMFS